jgi:flagellar hook-length control protein FliK
MIQAMTAMRSGAIEQGAPAPLANAAGSAGEAGSEALPGFDQHMLQAHEPVHGELAELLQLPPAPEEPAAVEPTVIAGDVEQATDEAAVASAESAAELWLLGILDQQALQVRARSAETEPAPLAAQPQPLPLRQISGDAGEPSHPGEPLPVTQPPAAEQLPQQTARFTPAPDAPRDPGAKAPAPSPASAESQPAAAPQPASEPVASHMPLAASALVEPASPAPGGEQPLLAVERGQAPAAASLERTLSLPPNQARWGEQMLQALREHVELQVQHKVQSATIRLDPPELGALEIFVSHESGRLTVQVSAAQADVARLLQQTSDRLRQELVGQHFVQVSVQVGADGQRGQQQPRDDVPLPHLDQIAAGQLASGARTEQAARGTRDVLVTV